VFLRDGNDSYGLKDVEEIWVGGESSYGFGRLRCVVLEESVNYCFGISLDLNNRKRNFGKNRRVISSKLELLAKPDFLLTSHSAEVNALGEKISEQLGLSEPLKVGVILACALHKKPRTISKSISGGTENCLSSRFGLFPF
jgi:hypothetical protein